MIKNDTNEDFGKHTPVHINIFRMMSLFQGYKSMFSIKYTSLAHVFKELSNILISSFSASILVY